MAAVVALQGAYVQGVWFSVGRERLLQLTDVQVVDSND